MKPATAAPARSKHSGHAVTEDVPPCPWCGYSDVWLSPYGKWTCYHCHPPATPGLVVKRIRGDQPGRRRSKPTAASYLGFRGQASAK